MTFDAAVVVGLLMIVFGLSQIDRYFQYRKGYSRGFVDAKANMPRKYDD